MNYRYDDHKAAYAGIAAGAGYVLGGWLGGAALSGATVWAGENDKFDKIYDFLDGE